MRFGAVANSGEDRIGSVVHHLARRLRIKCTGNEVLEHKATSGKLHPPRPPA